MKRTHQSCAWGMGLIAAMLVIAGSAGAAEYVKKDTWAETMLATRAACLAAGLKADDQKTTDAWNAIELDWPLQSLRARMDLKKDGHLRWLTAANTAGLEKKMIQAVMGELGPDGAGLETEYKQLVPPEGGTPKQGTPKQGTPKQTPKQGTPEQRLAFYERACAVRKLNEDFRLKVNFRALRMAVEDLAKTFPKEYTRGAEFLDRAAKMEARLPEARAALAGGTVPGLRAAGQFLDEFTAFQREALLANPLLDFEKLLLIKRKPLGNPYRWEDPDKGTGKYIGMPQQSSYQLHTMSKEWAHSFDNEIDTLALKQPGEPLETLYHSDNKRLLSDMDLHWDGDRVLFSMPDERKLWQLYEWNIGTKTLRRVSRGDQPDVHDLDGCYLPGGRIAFVSTAMFQGVPCNASVNVGMIYSMDADGGNIRQLCFDQDHNFCPTALPDGRIMFLRWEYADIPHVWARFLFTMNPDGTSQRELFGTGSYWPNGMWYARQIPHSTKVVAVVTGHHVGRQGELYIFDPSRTHEGTAGCVQQIPGCGKPINPVVTDKLTEKLFPKFLHPWPLSEKYYLAACRPTREDNWGIYLVDTFDNIVPVKTLEGWALLEPTPLKATPKPPVLEDRVNPARKDALIYISDIYKGRGLEGVPRGVIKALRLVTYHFAYRTVAGIDHRVGADGPWEPKVILGTVPVESDGSVFMRVPANTPLTVHALDEKGRTVQLMRSWMTAMPGEILSCVGCHEKVNCAPPNVSSVSKDRRPMEITPWRGPARGFDFDREVQPVLDKNCVSCHNGQSPSNSQLTTHNSQPIPDLRGNTNRFVAYKKSDPKANLIEGPVTEALYKKYGGIFSPSYIALRALVRPSGIESDLRPINSMEFDVRTTELVQMLEKGHHGVKLDEEGWDRLVTWIDLNTPAHGTWQEVVGTKKIENDHKRRVELIRQYSGIYDDPEVVKAETATPGETAKDPKDVKDQKEIKFSENSEKPVNLEGWPLDSTKAVALQQAAGTPRRTLDLGGGVTMELALIPAGKFVMGNSTGVPASAGIPPQGGTPELNIPSDEQPACAVEIPRAFWMGTTEVTNEQYARFDPAHDSRYEHKGTWKFEQVDLGWPLNDPKQPAVRISWQEAGAFCAWLSAKAGLKADLPTEAQWEYACRAGSATPFFFGGLEADFAPYANLADASLRELAYGLRGPRPPDLQPRVDAVNDGLIVTGAVGAYKANPWGLRDMHGNAWEWTRSQYKPYPYKPDDGREAPGGEALRTVRGGSWFDRPFRATSSYRLSYLPWQRVYNVGFRVIVEADVRVASK